jgi:hypothetical protein
MSMSQNSLKEYHIIPLLSVVDVDISLIPLLTNEKAFTKAL